MVITIIIVQNCTSVSQVKVIIIIIISYEEANEEWEKHEEKIQGNSLRMTRGYKRWEKEFRLNGRWEHRPFSRVPS